MQLPRKHIAILLVSFTWLVFGIYYYTHDALLMASQVSSQLMASKLDAGQINSTDETTTTTRASHTTQQQRLKKILLWNSPDR